MPNGGVMVEAWKNNVAECLWCAELSVSEQIHSATFRGIILSMLSGVFGQLQ